MNAFETELGVMPEIAIAVNKMGWLLPTDIQSDAIPLILGGGDVLMAAETGSGKTGAFCLPIIQIVYETLKEIQEQKLAKKKGITTKPILPVDFRMNYNDRSHSMAIDLTGLVCQSRDEIHWHGCRATKGVINKGKYYFEATVTDEGLCRVGWATQDAILDLGTDRLSFGFGGTGKKSYNRQFDTYGEAFGKNDVIGCFLDLDSLKIKWSKNGKIFEDGYTISTSMRNLAVCLKNAEVMFNFGETNFKYPANESGFIGISKTVEELTVVSLKSSGNHKGPVVKENNAPLALIIEPSRELAEQTLKQIQIFKKEIDSMEIRELLIVGGTPIKETLERISNGVDIVVATPGRLDDLINQENLSLKQVRFFVLDEIDALISGGYSSLINKIKGRIPQVSSDGRRIQTIVCSATLHNSEVQKLAEKLMYFPTWIDLKGLDNIPDTIHHCVCMIDPREDTEWRNLQSHITTDGVHTIDRLNYSFESKEMLSEAVKILKAEYVVKTIEKFNMDKALIFCRTKIDCDHLEDYFKQLGAKRYKETADHNFSCVCLHSDRDSKERSANLDKFKKGFVRFLICTDVAARGIDIKGLPFVINVTLPDEKQNYIHRIGRVGRADRMGLAISLVSKVPEKVWYHTCPSRGKQCSNRLLVEERGCCVWFNEIFYLEEIEDHLGCTIQQIPNTLDMPINEFDGKVVYGDKRSINVKKFNGHVEILEPSVKELIELERKTQLNFLNLKFVNNNMLMARNKVK